MTVEIAERLATLRRQHGYSQEELADKIGVSRQAVSKWERTESSPDTDNLIALAKLYNVSLDELLGRNATSASESEPSKESVENEESGDTIEIDADELGEQIGKKIEKKVEAKFEVGHDKNVWMMLPVSIIVVATYLILGFTTPRGWVIGWTLFLLIPVYSSTVEAFSKKDARKFAFPVLVAFVYLLGGMHWGLWHPYWIEFLSIPVYYALVDVIRKATGKSVDDDEDSDEDGDNVIRIVKNGKVVKLKSSKDGKNSIIIKKGDRNVEITDDGMSVN